MNIILLPIKFICLLHASTILGHEAPCTCVYAFSYLPVRYIVAWCAPIAVLLSRVWYVNGVLYDARIKKLFLKISTVVLCQPVGQLS